MTRCLGCASLPSGYATDVSRVYFLFFRHFRVHARVQNVPQRQCLGGCVIELGGILRRSISSRAAWYSVSIPAKHGFQRGFP